LEDENLDYSVYLKNSVHFLVVYVYIYILYTGVFFTCIRVCEDRSFKG